MKKDDRLLVPLMFCWFFITICSYAMLRPIRSMLVLYSYGPQMLPWMYMGTGLAAGAAAWIFSKFAGLPRGRLIGGTLLFFILNLFLWWWIAGKAQAARAAGTAVLSWTTPAFFIWTDVFSIMAVTVFWMYAADVFRPEAAKAAFGVISAAGPAGGALGSWLTQSLVRTVGPVHIVLIAAGIYLTALLLFFLLEKRAGDRDSGSGEHGIGRGLKPPGLDPSRLLEAARWIASSRLLLFLTLLVGFERMVPDFSDYIFQSTARASFAAPEDYAVFFAGFEKWCNLAALLLSLFLTAPILRRAGVRAALAGLPATVLGLGSAFLLWPGLPAVVLMKGVEVVQRHSVFKAGKEVVYAATERDVIYRIKGYIEMFVYRFARGLAGLLILLITAAGGGPRAIAAAAIPLAAAWVWAAWSLGAEYRRLEEVAR